jgi:hypothetical protein
MRTVDVALKETASMRRHLLLAGLLGILSAGGVRAQVVVLDNFDVDKGHFSTDPDFSGTTAGETVTGGPSNTILTPTNPFAGPQALQVFMDDDPAVAGTAGQTAWNLRLLSGTPGGAGGGNPVNNVSLSNTVGNTPFVGFWLRTTTPNLRASIMLDDGAALERAVRIPIIADDQWRLYEWNLQDAAQWDGFAGTGPNGQIDAATVTIDSIYIDALLDGTIPDQDATFVIDDVSFNPTGSINPVPEPSTLTLAGLGSVGLLVRRFRRKA